MLIERSVPERGASAVTIALAMVVILGFVAVAIDAAGFGFNERRQDQSAADVGALAAVQFAVPDNLGNAGCNALAGLAKSRCNGAEEAIEVANATLDDPSLAVWTDAAKCGSPPAGFTVSPVTNCVAFNANNQRAWVKIPTIERPTSIARAIGIDVITASADAIAGASDLGSGAVLPFLLPGNAAGEDHNCLKAAANPNFGSCDTSLPATGNFGSFDFFLYGNVDLDYTAKCSGDTNGRLIANIARGVDHPLGIHPTGSGSGKEEPAYCPDFGAEPDMAYGQPGVGSGLEQGLLYGGSAYAASSYPGRIQKSLASGGVTIRNAGGPKAAATVDSTPLWTFLVSGLSGPCDKSNVDTPAKMVACISWAKSTTTVVFDTNLASSTRFGWTPAVYEPDFLTPGQPYHIAGYVPVYVNTTMFACSSSKCDIMHTPGVPNIPVCPNNPPSEMITCGVPGSFNKTLSAVTAYILSPDIVPDNAKTPAPGDKNQRTYNLVD